MLSCFSCVQLFVAPWTAARQAPLSMEFSRREHWSGLPCPPPGDLPNPGIKPESPYLLHWQEGFLPLASLGKPSTHTHAHAYIFMLLFSHSVLSYSLQPHGLQHARLPCPSLSPGVCSEAGPLNRMDMLLIFASLLPPLPFDFTLSQR